MMCQYQYHINVINLTSCTCRENILQNGKVVFIQDCRHALICVAPGFVHQVAYDTVVNVMFKSVSFEYCAKTERWHWRATAVM